MRRHLMALTSGLALAGLVALASPQAPTTLTLKSGDTIRCELVDLGGPGFTVLVNGRERIIPMSDVAIIDFGPKSPLKAADITRLWSPGEHLVVLRNGATVKGELYDIGGRHPLRITMKIGRNERDLSSDDITQIYLAKPSTGVFAPRPPQPLPTPGRRVQVPARDAWTATGVIVRAGQTVRFQATGQVTLNREGYLTAAPVGSSSAQRDSKAPLPRARLGALVGRIGPQRPFAGNTGVFLIGDQNRVVMPAAGELYLGVNDSVLTDNSGAFTVIVNAGGPPRH
jgi:PA-IL-like protein